MSSELSILALYGLVVIAVVLVQVSVATAQLGLMPLAGPRDDLPEMQGTAGRCKRTLENSVVAMVLFAPAVLLLNAQSGFTANTLLAAQVFLIARIVYVPLYLFGIPWLRTLVWLAGFLATAYLYLVAV